MAGPSFHFRLERVRALRERRQQLAERELAVAIRGRSRGQQQLRDAEAHLQRVRTEQRERSCAGTMSAGELLLARQVFLERAEARHGERARELELLDAEVARRDAELATAASEHQMLKRLRERHRSAHDRELARSEQDALDEIATLRFGRDAA